jgi:hypothetical protein
VTSSNFSDFDPRPRPDRSSSSEFSAFGSGDDRFNPYGTTPRKRASSPWRWVAILLACGFVLLLFSCCGGVFLVGGYGLNMVTEEVKGLLADNPKLQKHVGEIESFEMNWRKSFLEDDDETFFYDVKGSKGSGQITVNQITNDEGDEEIRSAVLRLPDGRTVDLVP